MAEGAWSFAGRVMVVTGAAQGIGEATARLMAERGAAGLALVDRNAGRLARMAEEIKALGCPAAAIPADLADVGQCFAAIDRAAERFGALHGLVNAAGITDRGTIDDTTPELFDRIFAVDARAPFFLIQRVLPWLRRAGGGTVVNVISITVHGGTPSLTAYVGAKGALAAMTKNIAAAVVRDRVRVNGLNLGWTVTPNEELVQTRVHNRPADWAEAVGRTQPFGRLLTPLDAARAIAFLASDESGLMTGALVDFEQQVLGAYPVEEG
jgi:NAD(P)-dependent dehydrogenase (short-subunit alcohol dehydrogenase family)